MREEIRRTGVQIEAGLLTTTLKRPVENWTTNQMIARKLHHSDSIQASRYAKGMEIKKIVRNLVLHSRGFEHKNLQAAFLKSSQKQ